MPAAHLVADVPVNAYQPEAHGFVQADAARVGQGDPSVRVVKTLEPQEREQRGVQRPADPAAVGTGVNVRGHVGAPLVGRPRHVLAGVHVSGHAARVLADQPRIGGQDAGHPPGHLGRVRRHQFEGRDAVRDVRRIDRRDGSGIPLLGQSNPCRGRHGRET